jgi:hypothetical protein
MALHLLLLLLLGLRVPGTCLPCRELREREATRGAAPDAGRHRKQITQLASKMRFLSAQLLAMLDDELWRTLATSAARSAARLS